MGAFKNKDNGTWIVQFRYVDWRGENKQVFKRGFATKKEAQEYEREFRMQKSADVTMNFGTFVEQEFGYRNMGDGRYIPQSYCRECRSAHCEAGKPCKVK